MTPALVSLVAKRRFAAPGAAPRRVGVAGLRLVARLHAAALAALALSLPLWLIPPLVLRRAAADLGLAQLPRAGLRRARRARQPRRAQRADARASLAAARHGRDTGYLGAAPSLLWAASAALIVLAPLLVVVSVWLYTLVFAFSSLWFAHYALAALAALRAQRGRPAAVEVLLPLDPADGGAAAPARLAGPEAPRLPRL